MITTFMGVLAFALYLLYDINSYRWQKALPRVFFAAGTLLLAAATAIDLWQAAAAGALAAPVDRVLLAAAALFGLALIYCLFFALPFSATYTRQSEGRRVYDGGVYALCRHPGILCFFGMYLPLAAAAFPCQLALNGPLFALLDLAYALFQDRVTFPRTFDDYAAYREKVPFLIPTGNSIRMARRTLIHRRSKEDKL